MTTVDKRGAGIEVGMPGDPAYLRATEVFNLVAPAQPVAAVTTHTVDEIRAALRFADERRLTVRVHGTGHASAAGRPMRDALLIRTALGGEIEVDPVRRLARIPAGTRWGSVVSATAAHGLVAAHGSAATVGAIGYLLRGGLSLYGRRFGLAVNTVRAIELVTADGESRRVDAGTDPELFWALRGGGGGLGVVTAVEIDLFPATTVFTGAAFWPAAHAAALLDRWRRWTLDAPWDVTTSVRIMNLPAVPEVPPVLSTGPMLCVDGAVLCAGDDDLASAQRYTDELLEPLRAVAAPVLDTWARTTPAAVLRAHMDPADPLPIVGDHMLLAELGDEGIAEFLRVTGTGSGSPLVVAGLRQLGGAYQRRPRGGGALDHLKASYSYAGSAAPLGPTTVSAILDHCAVVRAALAPWDTGRTVPSFVERLDQPQRHLDTDSVLAVDRVRARVDPTGRFRDDIAPHATATR